MNNSKHHNSLNMDIVITVASSSMLMMTSVLGFGLYIWYLTTSEANTSRLLNNLYGLLAVVGSLASLILWLEVVTLATLMDAEDRLPFAIISHAIGILFIIIIFQISLATVLNHFKPQIYLEASVKWNNTLAFFINLVTALTDLSWTIYSCGKDLNDCFDENRTTVLLLCLPALMMISIIVIIDDVWGWERLINKVRYMFSYHGVTPVILITQAALDLSVGDQVNK